MALVNDFVCVAMLIVCDGARRRTECSVVAMKFLHSLFGCLFAQFGKSSDRGCGGGVDFESAIYVGAIMLESIANDEHDTSNVHVAEFSYHSRPSVT